MGANGGGIQPPVVSLTPAISSTRSTMRRRSLGLFIRVKSAGKVETDYTKFLKVGSLKGARIGVLRGYMGQNAETDRVVEESIVTLKKLGAVIVDSVSLPDYVLKAQTEISNVLHHSEFKASIGEYLKSDTKPQIARRSGYAHQRSRDALPQFGKSGRLQVHRICRQGHG